MVAQEYRPLAAVRNIRGLLHDLGDGVAVFLGDRHVNARHERKVICHVALIAVAEILAHILGPLICLREQEPILVVRIDGGAQLLDDLVRFAQILVVRALALDQIRDGVEAEPVDPHVEPETHDPQHRIHDFRIVEIQIGLVAEEAMPEIRLGDRIPGPVRAFGIDENDAGAQILLIAVAPDVEVPFRGAGGRLARGLEPRVLVGGVVDDEFGHHLQSEAMGLQKHGAKIVERAELRVDVGIFRDVVAVVLQRRGIERHEPDRVHTQVPDVFELRGESSKVADSIGVRIEERFDVELVDDRVFVPKRVVHDQPRGRGGFERGRLNVVHSGYITRNSRSLARCGRGAAP